MEHYGISVEPERRSTLPTWDSGYESRLIYSEDVKMLFYGSDTGWVTVSGGGGGISVHSALAGLDYASAGHTGFAPTSHSHTESNISDLDKYTESEVDTISGSLNSTIDGKSDTSHLHDDRYYTESEVDTLLTTISGNLDDHNELNNLDYVSSGHTGFQPSGDYTTESEVDTISGSLQTNIDGKSDTGHLHDDRYYTESEVNTISGSLQTNIDGKSDTSHNHDDRYYTESEVDVLITTISGKLDDHNELNNLDYASSGHTGFQPAGDYYTESEVDTISGSLNTKIDGKSDTSHLHDDRYYTESEIDTISGTLNEKISEYKTIYIDAAEFIPCTSDGALQGTYEEPTNDIDLDIFLFEGGATPQRIMCKKKFDENWDRGVIIGAKFDWNSEAGSVAGDAVEWRIKMGAVGDNDAIDAALGTRQVISDTLLANDGADWQTSPKTPSITVAGSPAIGDAILIEIDRNGLGADTMGEKARFQGVALQIKLSGAVAVWT